MSVSGIERESVDPMPLSGARQFRTRKDAEQALAEIIEDGGAPDDYRITEHPTGGFVIIVLDEDGVSIAGSIGI